MPSGYGIGISIGEAIRIQPETFLVEMNEADFVGYPLNCAARMQTLAAGYDTVVCSATARMLENSPDQFLHPTVPGFRRKLTAPTGLILDRAAQLKGLRPVDRTDFKYLSFVDGQEQLWHTSGIPDAA